MPSQPDHWWFAQRHPDGVKFCVRHTSRGPASFLVDNHQVSTDLIGAGGITRTLAATIAQALNEAYQLGERAGARQGL